MKKLALPLVAVVATFVACSSSSDPTADGADSAAPAGHNIVVKSNVFDPSALTINVGETVTWTWEGGAHTVTSGASCRSDGAYGEPLNSTVGHTFSHTYDKAGTFEFFCMPHCVSAGMKGTITVQ